MIETFFRNSWYIFRSHKIHSWSIIRLFLAYLKDTWLLGRKAMTNLDSILKSKGLTLPTKVCIVKVMVFSVVIYGCERWTIKKTDCRRIDAFELWCWRRLAIPLDCKEIKPSILNEVNPEYSLKGLMLKLKLQFFGYLMWRVDSFEKTVCAGKDWGQEKNWATGWDSWIASLAQWTWVEKAPGDGEGREGWHGAVHGVTKSRTFLGTELQLTTVLLMWWIILVDVLTNVLVWFTYLKIINFKCMVWWVLGNIHCCATTVTNYCPQCFLLPLAVHSSSYSRLWATSEMLSVWVILLFLEILYKRNHKICCFLCPFPHGKE